MPYSGQAITIAKVTQIARIDMNLKLNNEVPRSPLSPAGFKRRTLSQIKEERQRTGRYIAVLVGICLFLLAIYHAWIRKIPVIASLVVPALIMFIYVGWVLYTASKDKHRLMDAEAAMFANIEAQNLSPTNTIVEEAAGPSAPSTPHTTKTSDEPSNTAEGTKQNIVNNKIKVKPIILVNDELPNEDLSTPIAVINGTMQLCDVKRIVLPRSKFKRKFCRPKRSAVFKRSYTIG